ncbi:MAG: hypothetical protein LQ342_003782 [Letrouitia transgressa]|nr:MAG: hypothetical protein LQ342_003782 [Letrouitia transgressa]
MLPCCPSPFRIRYAIRLPLLQRLFLHTSAVRRDDLYKTLELRPEASGVDIKRQFYALSKQHHPDHNPTDPSASERFVKISEAYAILGNPTKRDRYDRDYQRDAGRRNPHVPQGSHSSSTPFGARPASGLSKRRTQFHGPPPSFYRSGGWGSHSRKRQAQAQETASSSAKATMDSSNSGPSSSGSWGSEFAQARWSNDVPHFDHEGHLRTQEQQDQRRKHRAGDSSAQYGSGGSIPLNFIFVSGVITTASLLPFIFSNRQQTRNRTTED